LGKFFKDAGNGVRDGLIWVENDLAIVVAPDKTDGKPSAQFTPRSLVADTAFEAGSNDMEFCFCHGSFESQQEAIIEQTGMIDAVFVSDQSVGDAAQIEQSIPVGIVSSDSGYFERQDQPHITEGNIGDHRGEAVTLVSPGTGAGEVFINDLDLGW
jgi:hypothetical protein